MHQGEYNIKNSQRGFTIIELLIAVVVIGILAAIVIVAYNGVQKRATDMSVMYDLRQIAQRLEMSKTDLGRYPYTDLNELATRGFKVNQVAYDTSININVAYCYNLALDEYALTAKSKSGKKFGIGTKWALQEYPATASLDGLNNVSCTDIGAGYTRIYSGYDKTNYHNGVIAGDTIPWRTWVTTMGSA